MGLLELLLIIVVLCVLLWVVNASGLMALPPPLIWGFNVIVLICFVILVLQITGLWHLQDIRIGGKL